jgi:hypothetical protein
MANCWKNELVYDLHDITGIDGTKDSTSDLSIFHRWKRINIEISDS